MFERLAENRGALIVDKKIEVGAFEDTAELRGEIIQTCLRLQEIGHVIGTWGNIGVRVEEGLLVTPTRLEYEQMKPDDLVVVSWEGERVSGERLPTSEVHLHRMVLASRPDLGVVIHTHSTWSSCVACMGKSIPPVTADMAQIIGGAVRCTEYVEGQGHMSVAKAAAETMGQTSTAVLLANHGAIVGARDLQEAVTASMILEKSAEMFVVGGLSEGRVAISAKDVEQMRYGYLHVYGTAEDLE